MSSSPSVVSSWGSRAERAPMNASWSVVRRTILTLLDGDAYARLTLDDVHTHLTQYICDLVERRPARALETISCDVAEVATAFCQKLALRLIALQGSALLSALAKAWTEFYCFGLPYFEAILLPLSTDPLLASLQQGGARRKERSISSRLDFLSESEEDLIESSLGSGLVKDNPKLNPRHICLVLFRDILLLPKYEQFASLFKLSAPPEPAPSESVPGDAGQEQRLVQMAGICRMLRTGDVAQDKMKELHSLLVRRWTGAGRRFTMVARIPRAMISCPPSTCRERDGFE